jgi:Domain of unknown function (DUF4124)
MRKIISISLLSLFCVTAFAGGEVYRWKDPNGTWHYSDKPQPGAQLVRASQRASTARPNPQNSPAPPETGTLTGTNSMPVSQEVATEVRQDAAKAKAEQCKKAEASYLQSVQAQRLYRDDGKGNRIYLTAAEIDAARLQARGSRDLVCK